MKRATSFLIQQFVLHVDEGLIVGAELSSGREVLTRMRDALQAILDGANPDQALGVERTAGAEEKDHTLPLAMAIHSARMAGDTWEAIKVQADEWLTRLGQRPLSLPRLKTLYAENKAEAERLASIDAMLRALRERNSSESRRDAEP